MEVSECGNARRRERRASCRRVYRLRARVRAAFFAAATRARGPFVFAALRAEAERLAALRLRDADFA